jgi:hypothetical protein
MLCTRGSQVIPKPSTIKASVRSFIPLALQGRVCVVGVSCHIVCSYVCVRIDQLLRLLNKALSTAVIT